MNRYLLLSTALVPLFGTSCDKPKTDVSDRLSELEQRVATAEQEAADARAAQQETERLLEEQRLAVERDALERERMLIEQERANIERLQEEQRQAAEEELRQREAALAQREQSAIDLQNSLSEQQQTLEQREAELSDRDRDLAGREALPDPTPNTSPAPEPEPIDVNVFYDSLSPYGSWFDSPDYGYVWRPTAYRTTGWRPYTHGRWACTDRGWMWISDEPFGWATYHYGRWALCRINGWIWVPGTQWAPSWVAWRTSGSHIGWAPLPPETLAYRGRHWDSTVEVTFGFGSAWFSFVEIGNFCQPIRNHCLPYTRNDYYWGNTVNITNIHIHNNRIISGGPSYGDIERQTKRRPPFYRIEEDRSGRHDKDRGYNRIDKGRVVVSPPRREQSRNPDAVMNRPPRISGRLDRVEVVRTGKLDQDIVREFQRNREEVRKTGAQPKEITQRPGENSNRDRGEEQRRLNEKAQDLEKDARKNVDDRIRVLPRPANETLVGPSQPKTPTMPPVKPSDRAEEQRRLNEKAQDLEKDARKNVDDRIRVLPRPADNNPNQPRVPNPPVVERPTTPPVSPRQPEIRRPQTPAQPPVLPRNDESRNQDNSRQQEAQQQQRQAEEQQRRRAAEEQQRQQLQQRQAEESRRQQQAAEESRRQQQRQAEENSRRQAEAQRENQRRQEQAAEESRRQQQRQAEESSRRQEQQRQAEESQRQQQRQAEENSRRQEQQRQSEEQQRRNRR